MKRKFVIGVQDVEGKRGLRFSEGCRVPAYPQKLAILLNPLGILRTGAKLHVDMLGSVDVNYKDNSRLRVRRWTRTVLVADAEGVTQVA